VENSWNQIGCGLKPFFGNKIVHAAAQWSRYQPLRQISPQTTETSVYSNFYSEKKFLQISLFDQKTALKYLFILS